MLRNILVTGMCLVLTFIACLHLYWGLGGFWPGHNAASLVDMVVGAPSGTSVPPFWACVLVAVCVSIPAVAICLISYPKFLKLPRVLEWTVPAALWFSAFVFIARGLSTYASPLFESAKGTAFYELDRTIYAPLCLGLGAVLILIWLIRPKSASSL